MIDNGDLVKCVDDSGFEHNIKTGVIYKVIDADNEYLRISFRGRALGGYKRNRFIKVSRKKTVWD
jgi:hypothetical protein